MAKVRFYQYPGWWRGPLMGMVIGGILGWAYYALIGCRTGTCAITGNPVNSSVYGALMGLIWAFPGQKKTKITIKSTDDSEKL